jgi:precorrin-4/cobalt-precorrin-4 C11-methyltransferase
MKVYFIGAGPGAVDLITVRGAKILSQVQLVLYAGSLVSKELLSYCQADTLIVNTAKLNLDEQEQYYRLAKEKNWDMARLHSGDPSIYGATAEQMRRLDQLEVAYEIVPGVPSFVSAAAVLNAELTKPNVSQTIILTRTSGRASPMPPKEELTLLAAHGATLCVFLSGANLEEVIEDLLKHYSPETPAALVQKATWPEQRVYRGCLGNLLGGIDSGTWLLTTMLVVGEVLAETPASESRLYAPDYSHRFRKASERRVQ